MAGRSLGTLTLDLIARIGGFQRGMDQAARVAEDRSRRIQRSARSMQSTMKSAFAFIGGTALIAGIARNTAQAEQELAQLDAALKSTGNAAGYSRDQLVSMAESFAKAGSRSRSCATISTASWAGRAKAVCV